ncbi:hypothetical protein, partial [Paraburkholderia sediminicola]|uniref:hypothetical protein n=1 Tax=Paraburkholderia sediminicola TaxID=458836 RepID=UPI0038B6D100
CALDQLPSLLGSVDGRQQWPIAESFAGGGYVAAVPSSLNASVLVVRIAFAVLTTVLACNSATQA